jgi:TPR repeat protein
LLGRSPGAAAGNDSPESSDSDGEAPAGSGGDAGDRLMQAAQAGDPDAMCRLGDELRQRGLTPEAMRWYRRAAIAGHAAAQYQLACCLSTGDGVSGAGGEIIERREMDRQAACVEWLRRSAHAGYAPAGVALKERADRLRAFLSTHQILVPKTPAMLVAESAAAGRRRAAEEKRQREKREVAARRLELRPEEKAALLAAGRGAADPARRPNRTCMICMSDVVLRQPSGPSRAFKRPWCFPP